VKEPVPLNDWLSSHSLELIQHSSWQKRKIGPEWECDFNLIGPWIVHLHMRFPKTVTLTEWKRFYQERAAFLEEHGPKSKAWCEVWSSDGPLPTFTLDERPLFLQFIQAERGKILRWYGVRTSKLFKAQKELLDKSPFLIHHPRSLVGALDSAHDVTEEIEEQRLQASSENLLFETETFYARITLRKNETFRVIFLLGKLHANDLKDFIPWIQDYLKDHSHLDHMWRDRLLGFSNSLTETAYQNVLSDIMELYPKVDLQWNFKGAFQKVIERTTEEQKGDLESSNELLQQDIEFLKRKNETLEASLQKETIKSREATNAKADFLNVINHELKTPLNGISGMIELLKSTELSTDQESFLGVAEQSSLRLVDLVNNLLEFSRIDSGELELQQQPFEANHLFDSLLKEKNEGREASKVSYLFQGLSEPLRLNGDIQRLEQIAGELISNAQKNTQSGSISLSLSILERTDDRVTLKVEISDTGIGIPKDKVSQLFSDFTQVDMSTTRRVSGSGLGLSLCRKLVGMMGGKMGLSSEEGSGARFWFSLPLELRSHEAQENHDEATLLDRWKKRHTLVVEDNAITRRVLVKELQALGLEVEVTGNGFAAIDLLLTQSFDLVIVDLLMPECDGFNIAKEIIQKNTPHPTPIFLGISKDFSADINSQCIEAGMADCLSKPISSERLSEVLRQHLPPSMKNDS